VNRRRFGILAAVALVGLGWAAAACNGGGGGDGGPLSLADYFTEYEKIDNKAEDATADLEREFDASLSATTIDDTVRFDLQEFYNRQIDIRQTYVDDVSDLVPPEEARAAHDASVTTYQAVLDAFTGIIDDLGQAQTTDDLEVIFTNEAVTSAVQAANKACIDLQQIADNNNINVNLECD
jgi:hypothetical protein